MRKINCKQLARELAQKGYSYEVANRVVDDLIDTIMEVLASGEQISIRNFGVFELKKKKVYGGTPRFVADGSAPEQELYTFLKFRSSDSFKRALNTGIVTPREPARGEVRGQVPEEELIRREAERKFITRRNVRGWK